MVALTAGLLAYVLLLQPAAATFNWGAAKPFNNPTNNNNICNDQQKGGFSWKDLPTGRVNKFGDFDFSGFDCKDSFSARNGRRALQARNGFQQKVIEGKCTADKATSPKISCGSDKNFSIKEMQITVEFDTDIDFEYTMPDGSSCKQTQKCSAGGSTIPNKQCGGAKEVTFKRPQKGRDCKIGIHKVDFDCEGPPPPPPPPPPPSTATQSTTVSTKSSSTVSTTSSKTSTSSTTRSTSKSSSTTITTTTSSKCTSCTQTSSTTTTTHTSSPCTSCQSSRTSSTHTSSTSGTSTASSSHTSSSQTSSSLSASSTSSPATSKTFTTLPPYTNTTASQSTQPPKSTTELPKTLTTTTSELPKTLTSTTSELPSTLPSTTSEPSKSAPSTTTAPETIPNTSEQVTTEFTFVTLTTCDVTLTQTTNNQTFTQTTQTLSTTTLTSTVTFCPKCGDSVPTKPGQPPSPPPSTSGVLPPPPVTSKTGESTTSAPSTLQTSTVQSSTSAVPPPPPPPPADTPQSPCPETLPRCMNTWLSLAKCTSNSDAKCMCPNSEFTKNVITCVTAWGASESEIQAALSYFAGICAEFVPQNPGICTDVPTSITLIPTINPTVPATPPPATSTGQVKPEGPKSDKPSQEVPCTTITLVKTVTATAGGIIQTTTQFITVPQVTFVTAEAPPAPPATAVAGGAAPPPAPAQPSIGLVPMPQLVQAGLTTAITAGVAAPTGTTVAAAAPSGGPVAAPTGAGSAQDPKPSAFTGAAVKNGAMLGGAGLLAAFAFVL